MHVIWEEIRSIDTSKKALRSFGWVVGGVLIGIAAVIFWRKGWTFTTSIYVLGAIGGLLTVLGLTFPTVLKPVYRVWMALAVVLGFIMTRVILTLVFFLVITPIGLILKVFGKDLLNQKIDRKADSYWIVRPEKAYDRSQLEKYY